MHINMEVGSVDGMGIDGSYRNDILRHLERPHICLKNQCDPIFLHLFHQKPAHPPKYQLTSKGRTRPHSQ